jgi:hypothetical protein
MRGWPAWVVESVAWWAASWAVWLASLSAVSGPELVVSAVAAIPCGILAVVGRRGAQNHWSFRPSWFSPLARLPLAVVSESVQILAKASVRHRGAGEFERIRVGDASGNSALASGRRGLSTLLMCITPASVAADFDVDSGEALVHVVPTHGRSMAEEVVG